MNKVIEYLIANSPWDEEDLNSMNAEELTNLAYSYGFPKAPKPKECS